jgi:hypothetical protein
MSPRPHLKEQEREIEARLDAYVAAEDGSEAAYHAVRAFEDRAPDDLLALLDALSAERARSAALTAEADACGRACRTLGEVVARTDVRRGLWARVARRLFRRLAAERDARALLAEVLLALDAADPNDTLGLHAQAINQAAGVACGSRAVPRPVPAGPPDEDSPF